MAKIKRNGKTKMTGTLIRGESVNQHKHLENSLAFSIEAKHMPIPWPSSSTLGLLELIEPSAYVHLRSVIH